MKAPRPNRRKREKLRQGRKRETRARRASMPAPILTPAPKPVERLPNIAGRTVIDPTLHWYVLQTFPGYEHRVSIALRREKIVHYLPIDRMVRVKRGRRHTVLRYALPRHMFIGVQVAGTVRDRILDRDGYNFQGIHDILRLHGRDVLIRACDVQVFADALALDIETRAVPEIGLKKGDEVLVIDGPFANFKALVSGPAPEGKIQVEVAIFGRSTPVDLTLDQVQAA